MYPRNAASPERIAVGAVVQISDGAVQTSGVSISVRGQGGASGAGSGTTAYDNGIVEYTPTQGETDFTSFIVVAYKTGCIPASVTIITSASATAGYVGTDQSKIANATATVDLSNTTIKNLDGNTVQTGDAYARIGAAGAGLTALGDTRLGDIAGIKAKTDNLPSDPADESLIIAATDSLAALIGTPVTSVAADIAAVKAVDDAIKTKTDNLPVAPAATGDIPTATEITNAVLDEAIAGHLTDGTVGKAISDASAGSGLDAAGVRDAVGLAAANLDTQLSGISTKTTNLPAAPAAVGDIPTAADIRAEIDANSTKLDVAASTRLAAADYVAPANATIAAIDAKTTNLPSDPADESNILAATGAILSAIGALPTPAVPGDPMTLESGERDAIAAALLALIDGVESGVTPGDVLKVAFAALGGKSDGAATTTMHFRNKNDDKNRITATVDSSGNRTAVVLDLT